MKKLFVIGFLLLPMLTWGQNNTAGWDAFFSFYHITDFDYGNGKIITAAENALFTTEIGQSDQQKKITTLNGLSGDLISAIHYLKDQNLILIGYENGLLQLYDLANERTQSFIDIQKKSTIPPNQRRINDFYELGNTVYIATNYGITEFNIPHREFEDTYFIGDGGTKLGVNAVTVFAGKIYAATLNRGVRYTSVDNPDIANSAQWQQIGSNAYTAAVTFQNNVYILNSLNTLKRVNGAFGFEVYHFNQPVRAIKATAHFLTVTLQDHIKIFNDQLALVANFSTNQFQADFETAFTRNGHLYIGDARLGMIETDLNQGSGLLFLSPNGPLRNDVFSLDNYGNELWLVYGAYNFYYNPYPLKARGLSHFKDGHWINIPYTDLPQFHSIINVAINPQNPKQVFFCSYHEGLLVLADDQVEQAYTTSNSNLSPTDNPAEAANAVRIGPGVFDRNGNFWFCNALSADGLIELPAGGGSNSFVKYDISNIINNSENNNGFGGIVIAPSGNLYLGSYRDGIIGYNPSTHQFAKVKGGKNQGNLPDNYISSLAIDHNGQLWIGTNLGLRVLFNPAQMFQNPTISTKNIVFLDDQGVAQELFAGLDITDIEVDGNNNKWIASPAGVYYISADGQKTFHHFTTDNSPLPSNDVRAIKIDGNTGEVYIATENGLVGFRGTATTAADNLSHVHAYPNPVRPNYHGKVTIDGLMKDTDVKITDVEGNLVYEAVSEGGSIQWDTRAFGKYKVASGVYFIMASAKNGTKTKIAKIMIIR